MRRASGIGQRRTARVHAAVVLALAGLFGGCTLHKELGPGAFGREPKLVHRGAPIPYVLEIEPELIDLSDGGVPRRLGPLLARSLYEVAHGGGVGETGVRKSGDRVDQGDLLVALEVTE